MTLRAHMIGARGAGMQALAAVLDGQGWRLTGSDLLGGSLPGASGGHITLHRGHAAEYLPSNANLVVTSDAVPAHNPELRRAQELAIPTKSYFQMVGELTAAMHCMAVAGTHGKTSTVAMCSSIFEQAGRDPLVFCGAPMLGRLQGGRFGHGPEALVEACEFRANFLHLRPRQAVLLGMDHDHFDCFPRKQDMLDAFAQFVQSIPPEGRLIVRADCPDSQDIAASASCCVECFSLAEPADWACARMTHQSGCYEFDVLHGGRPFCRLQLCVPGEHNAMNALAATALAHANGIPAACIAAALGQFPGVRRRLELLGLVPMESLRRGLGLRDDGRIEPMRPLPVVWADAGRRASAEDIGGGVLLVDDYAHHPTEASVALTALRQAFPGRRLLCVYQPHQALRLSRLLVETAVALQLADSVIVADVFRAREGPPIIGEADAARLADEVRQRGTPASAPGDAAAIAQLLASMLEPGDVLVTMGAGDIRLVAEMLLERCLNAACP